MNKAVTAKLADFSALYAGFSAAFRYPEQEGFLTGVEYLEAFDPGANASAASLHEGAYADHEKSSLFEELVRYYEHFGLRRHEQAALPDHLSVELEFMHFLCELEQAAARDDDVASLARAQRDFIDRHVRRLLNGLEKTGAAREGNAWILVRECRRFVEEHRASLAEIGTGTNIVVS